MGLAVDPEEFAEVTIYFSGECTATLFRGLSARVDIGRRPGVGLACTTDRHLKYRSADHERPLNPPPQSN